MSEIQISKNYATTLYAEAKAQGQGEKILLMLEALKAAFESHEVKSFLQSPLANSKMQLDLIEKLSTQFSFPQILKNCLKVAAKNQRLSLLTKIADLYQNEIDSDMGVIRGVAKSPTSLSPQQKQDIEKSVQQVTGKKPILQYQEDPSLLGGIKVQAGSFLIDGSVMNQLNDLKITLNNGAH